MRWLLDAGLGATWPRLQHRRRGAAVVLVALSAITIAAAGLWIGLRSSAETGSGQGGARAVGPDDHADTSGTGDRDAGDGALRRLFNAPLSLTVAAPSAAEARLARCLAGLPWVDSADIFLHTPEPSPFETETSPPTAMIVLRLAAGSVPEARDIEGVADIAVSAVPGLATSGVTIRDQNARLLYRHGKATPPPIVSREPSRSTPQSSDARWAVAALFGLAAVLLGVSAFVLMRDSRQPSAPGAGEPAAPLATLADLPPRALAAALREEPPAVRARLIAALPQGLRDAVSAHLPEEPASTDCGDEVPDPHVMEIVAQALRDAARPSA